MDDEEKNTRYKNSIDTFSLLEGDGQTENMEELVLGDIVFLDIIKQLVSDRQKFVAIALYVGFSKVEIASMLKLNPSSVTRTTQKMQVILRSYFKPRGARV